MKIFLVVIFTLFSLHISAKPNTSNSTIFAQEKIIDKLFEQQVKHQTNPKQAIQNSVYSLLKNYPEKIDLVLKVAISRYPHEYKQIICGALQAEPALTSDVVATLLDQNSIESLDLVHFTISEEPAYASEIVTNALLHEPDELQSIVRVAIQTEPVMAKTVLDDTMKNYPDKLLDILVVAIKALPNQVVNLVKDTLRISPDQAEEVVRTAVKTSNGEHTREIIATAIKSGLSKESATAAAIAGGANATDIASIEKQ